MSIRKTYLSASLFFLLSYALCASFAVFLALQAFWNSEAMGHIQRF